MLPEALYHFKPWKIAIKYKKLIFNFFTQVTHSSVASSGSECWERTRWSSISFWDWRSKTSWRGGFRPRSSSSDTPSRSTTPESWSVRDTSGEKFVALSTYQIVLFVYLIFCKLLFIIVTSLWWLLLFSGPIISMRTLCFLRLCEI